MSIASNKPSLVVAAGQIVSLGQLVTVTAAAGNPAYLVLNGLDRDEYTAQASGATGSFGGNGRTLGFGAIGSDMRGAGIVFSYAAASGRFVNATYGYLDQLSYVASTSMGDVTDLSLFGTGSASLANAYASNAIALAQRDAAGYLGTITVATEPGFAGAVPAQATPLSLAAVARTFVGSAWNMDGCWVLASTIAAEAGASLPVQSAVDMAGAASGEWVVAFNGPAGSNGDWVSAVRTGDVIGLVTASGSGHITTCVSGAGGTAMVIDNTTYVNAQGQVLNGANDGSADDIVIAGAHAASSMWSGVSASSVVIYRLDTPVLVVAGPLGVAAGGAAALAGAFSISDPAGRAITAVQAYTAGASDQLAVNGVAATATSAATAVTASSLGQITFDMGPQAVADSVTVRAFNGLYWGDWATIGISPVVGVAASTGSAGAVGGEVSIYRFFDTRDGTHFFTASATEAQGLATSRADLVAEGIGLKGYDSAAASPASEAVFRFFDTVDGTHFYTASASERDTLLATRAGDMVIEGVAFYEDSVARAGDTAVYRFFDTAHGTHLFTESAGERATILATRPDLVGEGIAFYAPV